MTAGRRVGKSIAVIHDEDPLLASPVTEAPVVVGVDDSHVSEAALGMAFDEAYRRGVDVVAVHARTDLVAGRLARWQRRYPEVGVRRIMAGDRPAHQLVEECASAQLLVVARRGGEASAFGRESTSDAVVEYARMPVIVTDDHEPPQEVQGNGADHRSSVPPSGPPAMTS